MGIIIAAAVAIIAESIIDDMVDEKNERAEQLKAAELRVGGITRIKREV